MSPWHIFEFFVYAMNFELPEDQKVKFWLFRPNLPQLGLFHKYFLCKSCFRGISMIKMGIWDQSKPIPLYLKIKKFKIKNYSCIGHFWPLQWRMRSQLLQCMTGLRGLPIRKQQKSHLLLMQISKIVPVLFEQCAQVCV